MKEFWALVSFEYRKILGKRSVKIALLLTLFLSVFSIWGTLMGSYYIEGELFESNAEAMKKTVHTHGNYPAEYWTINY